MFSVCCSFCGCVFKLPLATQGFRWFLASLLLGKLQIVTYHGCSSRSLVDLVLGRLDLGLQMSWRVKVLALLPRAASLNVVHTHSDRVVIGVDHSAVCRVGKAAVVLPTSAVTSLVFPTYLEQTTTKKKVHCAFTFAYMKN